MLSELATANETNPEQHVHRCEGICILRSIVCRLNSLVVKVFNSPPIPYYTFKRPNFKLNKINTQKCVKMVNLII